VFIENLLKTFLKEVDLQDLKLKGPGTFTLKNAFEPLYLHRQVHILWL